MRPLVAALALLPAAAFAAEAGDVTIPFSLGTNVWTHKFASGAQPASDSTIANRFALSEFPGAGVFLTDRFRVGLNLQLTEAITNPPPGGRFTTFGLLPQLNYHLGGPFTVSLVPSFYLRLDAKNQFGFALQGVFAAAFPLGAGFSLSVALEVPVYFTPFTSVGITPLVGVVYRIPRS